MEPSPIQKYEPRIRAVMPPGLTAGEDALELLPVATALVGARTDGLWIEACNHAYRAAGLGPDPARSRMVAEIGSRIALFLAGEALRDDFPWLTGDTVETRHFNVTLARIKHRRERCCLVTFLDQTTEARTEHSLRREMTTDSLTGLPNRAGFGDRLESAMAEDATQRFAVLVLDLGRFSRVNACMGSLAGDELLITVARRIRGSLRARDVLARTGGNEFGILLAIDTDRVEADHAARRIKAALATPFRLSDYEIHVDCAIGVAFSDGDGDDAEEVIRHAQFAVKHAKRSGQAESYQRHAFTRERTAFAMETELRRAIDARALRLNFQPVCDLATGEIHAFEALARWTTDDGRVISPVDFIPVAEETGLIVPLGRWALDEAARTLAAWDAASGGSSGMRMAVNLSAIQLQRDDIPTLVADTLRTHGLSGDRMKLELTESALISDPEGIAQILGELKALGVTLAMDDFGTGYSNLASLQRLPIDLLKIDRSLVTDMLADRDKVALVRAVLSLSHALCMKTVAEGIETPELGQTLAALGCTYGQGYAYARPLPADDAYALLPKRA